MHLTIHRKNYDAFDQIMKWVKQHCSTYITNDYHGGHHGNELIDLLFIPSEQAKQEILLIKLIWSEYVFEPKYSYAKTYTV